MTKKKKKKKKENEPSPCRVIFFETYFGPSSNRKEQNKHSDGVCRSPVRRDPSRWIRRHPYKFPGKSNRTQNRTNTVVFLRPNSRWKIGAIGVHSARLPRESWSRRRNRHPRTTLRNSPSTSRCQFNIWLGCSHLSDSNRQEFY